MKKIIAISLVALMILAMSIPMFAATEAFDSFEKPTIEIKKSDITVNLDGDLGEFDDMFAIDLKDSWMTYATNTDDQMAEVKSISTPLYITYDDTYFYFATYYKPATFSNEKEGDPGSMWQEAAIQANLSSVDAVGTDRLEFGVGITSDTNAQIHTIWADRAPYSYDPAGNYAVTNSGGTLKYEVRVPWTAFLEAAPKQGDSFGFCIVWAMGVGADHAHKQLAAGCTGDLSKSAENFAIIKLGAAPERPVEEVIEAPAAEATAPAAEVSAPVATAPVAAAQTSDSVVYLAVIAIVSLAAVVVVSKKIKE
jgi:hypothetical protein